jgi:uncharacterized SAM-binding protein YcdF (DUF218 family)
VTPAASDLRNARLLWGYLRLGTPAGPAECMLVLGGHDIGVASRAAELYEQGTAPLIVVSGGSRAVPDGSDSPTEADAIADVLLSRGVPKEAIALERLASNTSENFWLSAELLRDLGLDPATFLTVTKPYGAPSPPPGAAGRTKPSPPPPSRPPSTNTSPETSQPTASCPTWPAKPSA